MAAAGAVLGGLGYTGLGYSGLGVTPLHGFGYAGPLHNFATYGPYGGFGRTVGLGYSTLGLGGVVLGR